MNFSYFITYTFEEDHFGEETQFFFLKYFIDIFVYFFNIKAGCTWVEDTLNTLATINHVIKCIFFLSNFNGKVL